MNPSELEHVASRWPPVPFAYRGVWQRTLLQTEVLQDTETTVFWLQTARWHADIRVPAARPNFAGTTRWDDCSDAQLDWLHRQQGFAGYTVIDAAHSYDICTWNRIVDYQEPAAIADAGRIAFDGEVLVESGIHADYLEHWRLHQPAGLQSVCYRPSSAAWPDQSEWLLRSDDVVMYVRARQKSVQRACAQSWSGLTQAEKVAWVDFDISCGSLRGHEWTIQYSTIPWREGTVQLFAPIESGSAALLPVDEQSQGWHVLEDSGRPG